MPRLSRRDVKKSFSAHLLSIEMTKPKIGINLVAFSTRLSRRGEKIPWIIKKGLLTKTLSELLFICFLFLLIPMRQLAGFVSCKIKMADVFDIQFRMIFYRPAEVTGFYAPHIGFGIIQPQTE